MAHTYRVTLGAYTRTGRPLTTECITIEDLAEELREKDRVQRAFHEARRQFLDRTALVSGVRVEAQEIERRKGAGYQRLVMALHATPGTWIRLNAGWRCVDHWEPVGNGRCRLVTTDLQEPYEGVYARDDVFETR